MTPLRPPVVPLSQVALVNAIVPAASTVDLTIGERACKLAWVWHGPPVRPVVALDLALDGMSGLLLLDSDPFAMLVDLPLSAAEIQALPPSFQATLLRDALNDLVRRVQELTGLTADVRAIVSAEEIRKAPLVLDPTAVELGFRIIDDGRMWLRGTLRLAASLGQRLTELARLKMNGGAPLDVDGLPLVGRCVFGSTSLTLEDIRDLKPGDIVLLSHHHLDRSFVTVIIATGVRYSAWIADRVITIAGREESGALKEESDEATSDAPLADVDEMSVAVTVDLGRFEITIGELRRVGEGYVINLQRPTEGAVTLRVSGRPIGRGELVDIEGRLGVRVIEVFANNHG